MKPVIDLFGLEVSAYPLFACIGAICAFILSLPRLKKAGLSLKASVLLMLLSCIGFLIGARLWNYAVNPDAFQYAVKWYTLRLAGLSMYGGILGASIVTLLFVFIRKAPLWQVLDAETFPGGIAFCFARIGCFLNGCCVGKPTNAPMGIVFPVKSEFTKAFDSTFSFFSGSHASHPTQLYELFGAAIGIPVIAHIVRCRNLKSGAEFLLYGAWFSAVRLIALPFRVLNYPFFVKNVVYPLLYLFFVLFGIIATVKRGKKTE